MEMDLKVDVLELGITTQPTQGRQAMPITRLFVLNQ
jgi:hypothetical protein